ncbi:hypothetical protein ACFL67_00455 [candidate division KSB1 bacterium]
MKKYAEIVAVLFIISFHTTIMAQSIYDGEGHIPAVKQVEWTRAGLTITPPTVPDHVFNVTDFGANPADDGQDDTSIFPS